MAHAILFNPPLENNYLGHQIKEIYFDRVYTPYFEGKKDLTIIDVGANVGMTSYYFSQFAKNVYSLEPSLEHFDILTQMITHNKLDNVHPINKALYMKSGKFPLFHNNNKTMYSLHQAVADPNLPPEEVEAITFQQLFADFSIEHVDFLKTDVEGSEVELFCSTPFKEVAPKIDIVMTEVHQWNGRNSQQLIDGFKDAGFNNVQQVKSDASILVATK